MENLGHVDQFMLLTSFTKKRIDFVTSRACGPKRHATIIPAAEVERLAA
jgi:hypothetical protein